VISPVKGAAMRVNLRGEPRRKAGGETTGITGKKMPRRKKGMVHSFPKGKINSSEQGNRQFGCNGRKGKAGPNMPTGLRKEVIGQEGRIVWKNT